MINKSVSIVKAEMVDKMNHEKLQKTQQRRDQIQAKLLKLSQSMSELEHISNYRSNLTKKDRDSEKEEIHRKQREAAERSAALREQQRQIKQRKD